MKTSEAIELIQKGQVTSPSEWMQVTVNMPAYQKLDILFYFALNVPTAAALIRELYIPLRRELFGEVAPAKQETVESPAPIDPNKDAPPHPCTDVKVDDYVKLEGMNAQAREYLLRWGQWWTVAGGRKNNTELLLNSIAEQKRTAPKKSFEVHLIGRKADWNYSIVNVKKFPTETKRPIKE